MYKIRVPKGNSMKNDGKQKVKRKIENKKKQR